ncbi:MAG TPA: twin-arginine translocase subunit TatB, partial [Rhodobacteraceae bacterium]|nr:twin-arginine translocase subunit TatB [Paracoccaceae bacterium]
MFDIGFTELMVIGVVALIVVGPKDLPTLFRTLGRFTARMRGLGREFTSAMNAAADESGMKDVAKDLKGMTNPKSYGLDKLSEAADKFDNWSPTTPKTPPKKPDADDPDRAADIEKIRAATEAKGRETLAREQAAAEAPKPA